MFTLYIFLPRLPALRSKVSYNRLAYISRYIPLMYTSSVVHLPHVDQLLPSCPRNLVWELLVAQGFPGSLDDIHLVPRAGRSGGEILEASGTGHFEDEVLDTKTEALTAISVIQSSKRFESYQAVGRTAAPS
jgi:hypothetical protein